MIQQAGSMIKNFIRVTFPKVLDVFVALSFVGCLLLSLCYGGLVGGLPGFFVFLCSLFMGTIGIIVGYGVIYVLLDIRDSLQNK